MYRSLEVGADGFLNLYCHMERKVCNSEMVTPYSCTLRTLVRTSPVVRALAVACILRVKPREDTVKAVWGVTFPSEIQIILLGAEVIE